MGVHLPVDDLREWVVTGLAHPMAWTEETTRQFRLALQAALDVALRYSDAGFAVAIDHCHHLPFVNQTVESHAIGERVKRILLLPGVEACLERNRTRTNKGFDVEILEPIIKTLCQEFEQEAQNADGWAILDTRHQTMEESVDSLLAKLGCRT